MCDGKGSNWINLNVFGDIVLDRHFIKFLAFVSIVITLLLIGAWLR